MTTALIRRQEQPQALTLNDMREFAGIAVKSGVFKDIGNAERAIVKMSIAQALGLHYMDGLRGIHIFDGKIEVGAGIIASKIKSSGVYNYHILQHNDEGCAIRFVRVLPDGTEEPVSYRDPKDKWGTETSVSVWSKADTERAGLAKKDNHAKYPKAMNFARALSAGQKLFCPEVLGSNVYVQGETSDLPPDEFACATAATTAPVVTSTTPVVPPPAADDATDVPFEPAQKADPTSPPPAAEEEPGLPKHLEDMTADEVIARIKSLITALQITKDQAVRMIQRRDPKAQKLADLPVEALREICAKLADMDMTRLAEAG